MQIFKDQLSSGQLQTILGGFIGSWFFIFFLTGVSNMETILFGKGFQTKLFPEVVACIVVSAVVSGLVHRVSATVCVIFSIVALYYLNSISHKIYGPMQPKVEEVPRKGRAKK
jgi:membrane protease YdiL (CAAX protease family)